jgi:hypothetical protein
MVVGTAQQAIAMHSSGHKPHASCCPHFRMPAALTSVATSKTPSDIVGLHPLATCKRALIAAEAQQIVRRVSPTAVALVLKECHLMRLSAESRCESSSRTASVPEATSTSAQSSGEVSAASLRSRSPAELPRGVGALVPRFEDSMTSGGVRPALELCSALLVARSMLVPVGFFFFLINTCTSVPSGISTCLKST